MCTVFTHHVAMGDHPTHDLLASQLSTADVFLHFLAERGHHLVVEAIYLGEGEVGREPRATGQLVDTSPHLEPSKVVFTYKNMHVHVYIDLEDLMEKIHTHEKMSCSGTL